ncbi:MAG: DUF6580 family putative transport protein [Candidatus Thermoplasmatota archaeon]
MIDIITKNKSKILTALLLITIGITGRLTLSKILPTSPQIYLNIAETTQPLFMMDLFFLIAIISLLSGLILGSYYAFIIPITVMTITDVIMGNNYILLFTWSGFAMIGIIGYILKTKNKFKINKTPTLFAAGIGSILLYDLWTNFGSWLGWYPHTIQGLTTCYIVSLPFTLWHILSTTIAMTLTIIPITYLKEKQIFNLDYTVKRKEKPITAALLASIMILSIISAIL